MLSILFKPHFVVHYEGCFMWGYYIGLTFKYCYLDKNVMPIHPPVSFIVCFNSLRPSDVYIHRLTNHHVSDNGLSPGWRQAIIWTNAGISLIRTLGTNFSEILSEISTFLFKKMHLNILSAKRRPFYLGLNVFTKATLLAGPLDAFSGTEMNDNVLHTFPWEHYFFQQYSSIKTYSFVCSLLSWLSWNSK